MKSHPLLSCTAGLTLSLTWISFCFGAAKYPEDKPTEVVSEAPASTDQNTFELVSNGVSEYVIVTDENPAPQVQDAVEELNYWIKRISGAELKVTTTDQFDASQPYIAVGVSALTKENGWSETPFAQEEARIFIEPGRIGLVGNDATPYEEISWTGTYYAVLEFIQKSLNARWIWPGELGEIFEHRETIAVEPATWSWKPTITLNRDLRNSFGPREEPRRILSFENHLGRTLDFEASVALFDQHNRWLKRERMNKPSNVRFGHAFSDWWENYHENHLDWFAQPPEGAPIRGGKGVKLNLSNPEVQEQIISLWKAAWEKNPKANQYLNVAPNDSRGFDTRPETRAWDAPEMQKLSDKEIFSSDIAIVSDRYAKFWNILARRAREIDPKVMVSTYAYRNYRKPPLATEKLEENIIIGYVGGEGYYPDERFIVEEWKKWADLGATMAWRPNLLHCGGGAPYLYSRQLAEDFKFFHENALRSSDFDSLVGFWSVQGLNYYVLAELHSRPETSYETLADEFFSAFGPAKEAIRDYHTFFEKNTENSPRLMREHNLVSHETWGGWWKAHIRVIPLLYPPEVLEQGAAYMTAAKEAVAQAPKIYQDRVAFIEKGLIHTTLMAETFRKLNLQDPNQKLDPAQSYEILKPLWDLRMTMLTDLALPVSRLFTEEQRQLKIWQAFVETQPAATSKEEVFPLDANWLIRLDPDAKGLTENWQTQPTASSTSADWQEAQIAMPWRRALPEATDTESHVVWYRTQFKVPDLKDTGEHILLRFGSVDSDVKIWINGTLVHERGYPHNGSYESWSEPFEFDVAKFTQQGADNQLVIRVESKSKNAGITGKVHLVLSE